MVILGRLKQKSRITSNQIANLPASLEGAGFHGEVIWTPAIPSFQYDQGSEAITYSTRRRTERHLSNFCHHVKGRTWLAGDPLQPRSLQFLSGGHAGHPVKSLHQGYADSKGAHAAARVIAENSSNLDIQTMGALKYRGDSQVDIDNVFVDLQPDLTEISLPNFLFELRDVQKLYLSWKDKLAKAQRLARATRLPTDLTVGRLATGVASQNLELNFGILPLVGDLKALANIFTNLRAKLEAFENACENELFHSKKTFFKEVVFKSGTFDLSGSPFHKVNWNGFVRRTKKAGFTYRLKPFSVTKDYKLMLRAYADALGFELNPRILWDALPFTFVLDWFLDVGGWLERHKFDTLSIPFVHVDSYVSYEETYTVQSTHNFLGDGVIGPYGANPAWNTTRRFFIRIPAHPSPTEFTGLNWKSPTLKQWALGVSLAKVLRG